MSLVKLLDPVKRSPYFSRQLSSLKRVGKAGFPGMIGSSSAAILAALADDLRNILIITSSSEKSEALKSEIKLFSGVGPTLFPAPDTLPGEEIKPSNELIGERLAVLNNGFEGIVVAPVMAVMWRTSRRLESIKVSVNQNIRLDELIKRLIEFGHKRFDIVGERGEFSVRGGILDIFPLNFEHPVRIELSGDKIESIRYFNAYSQRSTGRIEKVSILPAVENFEVPLFERLPKGTIVILDEPMEISRAADQHIEELAATDTDLQYLRFEDIEKYKNVELSSFLKPDEGGIFLSPKNYQNRLPEIPQKAIVVSKHAARLKEKVEAEVLKGSLRGGFILNETQILSDREIFGEEIVFRRKKSAVIEGVADELLADLTVGDYVVHENYGIGIYCGMETLDLEGVEQEYLLIEFAAGDKVYVPPSMAGLIEKYSSGRDFRPKLNRLGTKNWIRTKGRIKKELKDMTQDLLKLYAARKKLPGHAYPKDDLWQKELEGTFPFEETIDQSKAIAATKRDMEAPYPMDRLICGDVGYGKTEVAIRAAAKAVSAGKQVAVLVPTTILADQHYNNFKERFKTSPFMINMLSRFRSKKEQAEIVKVLGRGGVDIVIGTHRLLSKDIKFKDLGLLILDEEQRFGVAHKEKLKKIKLNVDVLTLSATPIPRTLYLSLSGSRDMSTINTPPVDRSPIRTYVLPWSGHVIREAILREIDRGGQIYFVHNIVETIDAVASKIKKLVPEAKIGIGHGQMSEKELEKTMVNFLERRFNVLVCTSIIESGLDITNVNTILIDNAERFGLSQLYQIRGRVGRSAARAYAYLFYHPEKIMSGQALERLKAIQEFTALGSGYKLAMRDLEIRGAGNLLGSQQSGHVMEVGFDLYCELLEEAVREVKGIKTVSAREVIIDLKVEAYIPEDYVTDDRQRIALYRRMNHLSTKEELSEMKKELRDRFGTLPGTLNRLFDILNLRVVAIKAGIVGIKEEGGKLLIDNLAGKRKKVEIKGKDKINLALLSIAG
ncbi:MAG: transcription-repair coupling factor [Candidatus Margulisiibacteriota bacterium]|nr:transcription-repair coupling factor [Candidatus Margulisiibacteriota bacterium]